MRPLARAALSGAVALGACLGGVAWLDSWRVESERAEIERDTQVVAVQFASRVQGGLEQHRIALRQTGRFFENSPRATEENFYNFATTISKLTPRSLRISFVDSALRFRWVYPPEVNQFLVGFDARAHPQVYATLKRARETRTAAVSPPLELIGGGEGFNLAVPVFRQEKFLGEVVGAFQSADFFTSLLLPEVQERFEERVLNSGRLVFSSAPADSGAEAAGASVEKFTAYGIEWAVEVRLREEAIAAQLGPPRALFWTLGALFSLAAALAAALLNQRLAWGKRRAVREALSSLDEVRSGDTAREEKMAALRSLVAGFAQEVNNPLCTILGYTQLLLAREVPAEVRTRLEMVHSEAERMGRTVKTLLTFAGKQPPEKKYLGLNGIIEKTLEMLARDLKLSQVRVDKDLARDLPLTMLDFHQIQQVFLGLIGNAREAIAEAARGGGALRITTRRAGDHIEARVTDDGPGIPKEIQSRIFEPFFTTRKDRDSAGLGLSQCYGIVREHGGHLRAESAPREGATFIIDLPIVHQAAAEGDSARGRPAPSLPRLRILVVDGEPGIQDVLVDMLTSKGHKVDTASDVPEALKKIASDSHDLVIAEMRMRHGTGRDIYKAVAEKAPTLAGRIIFTAGDGAGDETLEFARDVGNEILLKPFQFEQLEKAIARAMGT